LTPAAAAGIGGCDGVHYAIGKDDAALIEQVLGLLTDAARATGMAQAARRLVIEQFNWQTALAPLDSLFDPGQRGGRHAA